MRKRALPEKFEFNLEISFVHLGEFVFKEIRQEAKGEKPAKEAAALYVFPRSTAAIVEI